MNNNNNGSSITTITCMYPISDNSHFNRFTQNDYNIICSHMNIIIAHKLALKTAFGKSSQCYLGLI